MTTKRKSINEIVGRSNENLAGASDRLLDIQIDFSPKSNYALDKQDDEIIPLRAAVQFKTNLDRQGSLINRKMDQFEAARHGNMDELKLLYREYQSNRRAFFNRLDPETKLTALHYAARFHHLEVCQFLVAECEADVVKPGEDGMTPLHYVARFRVEKEQVKSLEKIIQFLVSARANVNARDDSYATPLHHACERDNVECAKILLQHKADIKAVDRQRMTVLHTASFYGSIETARMLIEYGSDVLAADKSDSIPFAHASRNGHFSILEMFFRQFENHPQMIDIMNAIDIEGNTLLHLAVAAGNASMVELLLSKGSDPLRKREDGQSPVHLCTKTDSSDILDLLLQAGANINDTDKYEETIVHKCAAQNKENLLRYVLSKQTVQISTQKKNSNSPSALLLACGFGNASCVALLLENSPALLNDRDKKERNAIYLASMNNHLRTLKTLIQYAVKNYDEDTFKQTINHTDQYNRTALHAASELGHVEIVEELLNNGASLTMKDDNEHTALMLACKKNRLEVLNIFIERLNQNFTTAREKLNVMEDRDDGSNTALHIAAAEGHPAIVKILLEENCDIQSRNMISWLPIHCAAEHGRYNSLRVLIENHSPIDPVDKNQQTPLHLAARNGHSEIVKFLLKQGAEIDKRTSNGDNCLDLAIAGNHHSVAETLINHRDWESILRNASFDEQNKRWETPLRKLIRRMPDIALIVLNKSCKVVTLTKNEQISEENKKKKSNVENIVDLEEQINHQQNQIGTVEMIKDETQRKKLKFIYTYEFLDDQFLLKSWMEGKSKVDAFEPDGILYPRMQDKTLDRKCLEMSHPFQVMVDNNRAYLLDHPVVHSLLDYKWKLYPRYVYYFNFLFFFMFVSALTAYVFICLPPYEFGITHSQMQEMNCFDLCSLVKRNQTMELSNLTTRLRTIKVFQWIVIVLASIQILKELGQVISERFDYINLENLVELTAFVLAILFTVDLNSCSREIGYRCVVQWQIGASAIFLSWFALVLFIQKFPRFGIFVVMLTDILRTFSRFFLVFFLFIIGFALSFHMLLQNHNPFEYFGSSLLKTCVMMIGEFDYEGIFHGEDANYFGITYFFFVVFIIVMSIIIMNLLVGLAVDDIASVMRTATVKRLEMRVRLTLDVERKLSIRCLFDSIRRFRVMVYSQTSFEKLIKRVFGIQLQTNFDKAFRRLQNYGLISSLSADQNQANLGMNVQPDWINTMQTQINNKYNEFNRYLSDLKTQQDRINQILQQFPPSSAAASRQGSVPNFGASSS